MAGFAIRRTAGEGWTYIDAEPRSSFLEYGAETFAGDGTRVEAGYVSILWEYDRPISGLEMAQFLNFCPGASADVFVRTKSRSVDISGNPVWKAFLATMHRPDSEFIWRHGQQYFINVKVIFRGLAEVPA